MAIRQIRGSWWVDLRSNHRRYRKRSPENSKKGAKAYEAQLRHKLANGISIESAPPDPPQPTFEDFAETWLETYVVPNNKYAEQRTKRYILRATLIPFFGKIQVGKISPFQIEQYKARMMERHITSKTLRNHLSILNKCLSAAYEWLNLKGAPPKIQWPKGHSYRTDFLTDEECSGLLSESTGVVHELILTALRTGMRQGELKGLQWDDFDWENRLVNVRHSRCDRLKAIVTTKNNRERAVPLSSDVFETLERRRRRSGYVFLDTDDQPFDHKRLSRRITKACKSAGMRKITWHVLRHTFASHLAMRGVPLPAIQVLLGHANITTTSRYAHVAPSTLRAAVDMLTPKQPISLEFGQPAGNQWQRERQEEMFRKAA